MENEIIEQLYENFPVLQKLKNDLSVDLVTENEITELLLKFEFTKYKLDQQDCLELSQLFALLATAFQTIEEEGE